MKFKIGDYVKIKGIECYGKIFAIAPNGYWGIQVIKFQKVAMDSNEYFKQQGFPDMVCAPTNVMKKVSKITALKGSK